MVISRRAYSVVPIVICQISFADTPEDGVASAAVGATSTAPATIPAIVRPAATFWTVETEYPFLRQTGDVDGNGGQCQIGPRAAKVCPPVPAHLPRAYQSTTAGPHRAPCRSSGSGPAAVLCWCRNRELV